MEAWKKPFVGTEFYLIFSDAYPNNPASMFGHTFVLFSKTFPPDSAKGFLDYSINFSADTPATDEKSLLYTIKGLFGGYPSRYRLHPFYQMTNQYINWDSRDLWYLKVPWTQEQNDRFLEHVWEIFTNTHFDYYFLDENCSYRLLSAMDYADPGLNLVNEFYSKFPVYYVSPISTYKYVAKRYKNLVSEYYTPSIRKSLRAEIQNLSPKAQKDFKNGLEDVSAIKSEKDPQVLDALISYFDYRKRTSSKDGLSEEILGKLDASLRRRAAVVGESKEKTKPQQPSSPLQSHSNKSIWIGGQSQDGKTTSLVGGKVGYHDFLSPSAGYERWSHLNFLQTTFQEKNKILQIDSLVVADIISFFPVESYDKKISWRVEGGYDQEKYGYLKGGIGGAIQSESELELLYVFVSPVVSGRPTLTDGKGYFFEPEVGFAKEFSQRFKIWLYYREMIKSPRWDLESFDESIALQTSFYIFKNHEFRFSAENKILGPKVSFSWQYNFQYNFSKVLSLFNNNICLREIHSFLKYKFLLLRRTI